MNSYVRLTSLRNGMPVHIDCDYIVSVFCNDDGKTVVTLRVRDNEYYVVKESPDEVAQGIADAYFPQRVYPAGFFSPGGVTP